MTLKIIETELLKIGMYVQKLHGSWLRHPFWRNSFMIDNQEQIDRLVRVGVRTVTVDIEKSMDSVMAVMIQGQLERASERDMYFSRAQQENEIPEVRPGPINPSVPQGEEAGESEILRSPQFSRLAYKEASKALGSSMDAVAEMFENLRFGQISNLGKAPAVASEILSIVDSHPAEVINLVRLKTKDNYTFFHSVAVSAFMILLSRVMGLSAEMTEKAAMAGLMHDIGKSSMPDMLLKKAGPLSAHEFSRLQKHPRLGAEILRRSRDFNPDVVDACLYHHERYDGSGYPVGLVADETPLLARMVAVCDVYDAITSERSYKTAWDPGFALHKMATWKGHFDPLIFQAFVKVIGVYPVGSLVRLHTNRLAVVIRQSPHDLLNPVVRVFYCAEQNCPIERQDIDLCDVDVNDSIASRENRENWMFSARFLESVCQR